MNPALFVRHAATATGLALTGWQALSPAGRKALKREFHAAHEILFPRRSFGGRLLSLAAVELARFD